MDHIKVDSSNVHSIGYDGATKTLQVRYKGSGKTYEHQNVPYDVHAKLMLAGSVGKYLNANIKPHYAAKEV